MFEIFIIGAIFGYFLPYLTFVMIAAGLYLKMKGGSSRLQDIHSMAWKKLSETQMVIKLAGYLAPFIRATRAEKEEEEQTPENLFDAKTVFIPMDKRDS